MFKVIVFDLDGVILKSNEMFLRVFKKSLKINNQPIPNDEKILRLFGKSNYVILSKITKEKSKVKKVYRDYAKLLNNPEIFRKVKFTPHAKKALLKLKKNGYKLALATGNEKQTLEKFFKYTDVPNVFDVIITVDDVKKGKPAPDMLNKIVKRSKIGPNEVLYVGDAPSDIEMGKKAKVKTAAVLTGVLNRHEAKKFKPDYIIENLKEIDKILK